MGYSKYMWVGNRIAEADMSKMYCLKQRNKKPITQMVAEAVSQYVINARTDAIIDKNELRWI